MSDANVPFLQRVILRNYKSIKGCDVSLRPLMLLVGPNGSGKSNFLDALRFVAESLRTTMDQALRERGGINEVCHRLEEASAWFSIDLWVTLPLGGCASYGFTVVAKPSDEFEIQEEHCRVSMKDAPAAEYAVQSGEVKSATFEPTPPASSDRLYLSVASGFPEFRPLFDLLLGMLFYSIDPERTRSATFANVNNGMMRNGAGVGSVLRQLARQSPQAKQRIDEYMHAILPAFDQVRVETLDEFLAGAGAHQAKTVVKSGRLFLWFVFHVENKPVLFSATNMSDGTLRAFGVLVALFQCVDRPSRRPISLVGIEEPEATLHPAAAGVLFDALNEASHFTQVLVTTHSVELLDIKELDPESLLVVEVADGETVIGPADDVSLSAMRERMYTAGELLEMNQLRAAPKGPEETVSRTADSPSGFPPNDQ